MPPSQSCGVCTNQPPKYKCPSCELRYCSIACYKTHKSTGHADAAAAAGLGPGPGPGPGPTSSSSSSASTTTTAAASTSPNPATNATPPTAAAPTTSPPTSSSPHASLLANPSLAALFTRYPTLRQRLQRVYASTQEPDPATLANAAAADAHQSSHYQHRGGRGGRGRGRGRARGRGGTGGGGYRGGQWKQEVADRAAVKQLLRMRTWEGEVGEGVREFVALVAQVRDGDGDVVM